MSRMDAPREVASIPRESGDDPLGTKSQQGSRSVFPARAGMIPTPTALV